MWRLLGLFVFVLDASSQPVDTVLSDLKPIASFTEARAVASDGAGYLYVVDSGRDVVVKLNESGAIEAELGGPGIEPGSFDDPTDIDPTNGLVLIVADAGNGRLQLFSREFMPLKILPVSLHRGDSPVLQGLPADRKSQPQGAIGEGRPIAVASPSSGEIYTIDAAEQVVLKWNRAHERTRTIGGYDVANGALSEPVALTVGPDGTLYVADAGHECVLVFDPLGNYVRKLADGIADGIRAVTINEDVLWILLEKRLLAYKNGQLERVLDVRTDTPLVDVVVSNESIYLLTPDRLYQTDIPNRQNE